MFSHNGMSGWRRIGLLLLILVLAFVLATGCATRHKDGGQAGADGSGSMEYDPSDAFLGQEVVDSAAHALERMLESPDHAFLAETLPYARGVLLVPNYCKVSWIYGVGGGMGVFLGRAEDGSWSGPAFMQLAHAGVGFQAGVQRSTLVYVFLDESVVEAALESGFEFGAGAELTVIGDVAHTGVSNRISERPVYLFAMSDGLWAGIALEGGVVDSRDGINQAYYASPGISPREIVLGRAVSAPDAGELVRLLSVEPAEDNVRILQ